MKAIAISKSNKFYISTGNIKHDKLISNNFRYILVSDEIAIFIRSVCNTKETLYMYWDRIL